MIPKITKRSLFVVAIGWLASGGLTAQTNVFPSSGDVGIGTTSPAAKLEVERPFGSGGPNDVAAFFGGRTADSGRYNIYVIGHTIGVGYGNDSDTSMLWINWRGYQAGDTRYRDLFVGDGRGTAILAVDGSEGNVGVGTTSPNAKLEVSGVIKAAPGSYNATPGTGTDSATDAVMIWNSGNAKSAIYYEENGYLRNVLSMNAPTNDIDIGQSGTSLIDSINLKSGASGIVTLYSGGSETVRVTAGNVGIGTTTPGNKLEVNGTVRAKEVVVESTGWPDFVLEESYPLQSLDAVEEHIRANKHLPGVPSASEIAETGVSIGEMQRTLLQKVEELTLYIIEQNRINAIQAQEIETLKLKLSSLEMPRS